jgi:hypothetical protein
MPLSWNEIKKRAIEFSKSWETAEREKAEAQTFWNEFFEVFGVTRRRVAVLEQEVRKLDASKGYIDLFWPKVLLAEAKSKGKDLVKAKEQAISYLHGISDADLPKFILTSDFENMTLLDLETDESHEFKVAKLHENIKLFSFIAGYTKTDFKPEDPVNIKAAELMGQLHDTLKEAGYAGHPLEVFLVRILFCLFADDTGIFEKGIFFDFIRNKTHADGTDTGPQLAQLFQILNTPEKTRFTNIDEDLARFPYVNGSLFEEVIPLSSFDSAMRAALITCSAFDWSKISPAIFGSLFQSVMNPEQRRNMGAHYTTEENILKLIRPLFLDDLWEEFHRVKSIKNKLVEFHNKLAGLKFLDPACGCGNFLVITYRELRLLELEIIKIQNTSDNTSLLEVADYSKLNVDQMYGIELEEFPAKIAEVAMWLMDHQMNIKLSELIGKYYVRLPLKTGAKIVLGNALHLNWEDIVPKNELSYMLGNPPFVGKQMRTKEQKDDLNAVMKDIKGAGVLDYVACWYIKAAKYIQGTRIKVALVSTNSISQGEQVGILWNELFNKYGIKIHFAHRTFQWNSEARGKAAVHVVIVGFGNFDIEDKYLFEYENIKGQPHKVAVKKINPYLVEGGDIAIKPRPKPLCSVPPIVFGSMPNDGGNLLLTDDEKKQMLAKEPYLKKYIRPLISAYEYLNGLKRYCLWLNNADPGDIVASKLLKERIEKVKQYRLESQREATRKLAEYPGLFGEIRQPETEYILIPSTSSENRLYVPASFFDKNQIANNSCLIVSNAKIYHYGIIQSQMHMTWMRYVAGRLESRYRYSNKLVYNNFPWPEDATDAQKNAVEEKAQAVLDARKEFPEASLADLYNPLTMPPKLLRAHKELDLAVDKCYRSKQFKDERERIEFLFSLFEALTK